MWLIILILLFGLAFPYFEYVHPHIKKFIHRAYNVETIKEALTTHEDVAEPTQLNIDADLQSRSELQSAPPVQHPLHNFKIIDKFDFPYRVGEKLLYYQYNLQFIPDEAAGFDINDFDSEPPVILTPADNEIIVSLENGLVIGKIDNPGKVRMLSDFMDDDSAYLAAMCSDGKRVAIWFYRDKRIKNAWREQTVVSLKACRAEKKQDIIRWVQLPKEVKVFESDTSAALHVCLNGEPIGKLPAKIEKRYDEEGAALLIMEDKEKVSLGGTDFYFAPVVRIYW